MFIKSQRTKITSKKAKTRKRKSEKTQNQKKQKHKKLKSAKTQKHENMRKLRVKAKTRKCQNGFSRFLGCIFLAIFAFFYVLGKLGVSTILISELDFQVWMLTVPNPAQPTKIMSHVLSIPKLCLMPLVYPLI